jgi:adenosylhomocysteine nucleosidase
MPHFCGGMEIYMGPIGIIGAMSDEVSGLISRLQNHKCEKVGGIEFHTGTMFSKNVVIAQCGVGKVFAAMCAEAMIIKYNPSLLVNTGVGGAIAEGLSCADIVVADKLVQHDMDTSPLGDPKGMISGINKIWFETDERAVCLLAEAANALSLNARIGPIATGDRFVATKDVKKHIVDTFGASACEMEGGAIAQIAFINNTPFVVVRAISDSADGEASMDYPTFLGIAAKNSTNLTLSLVAGY